MVTAAMLRGFRSRVPAKMTSSIRAPRRLLADCSPRTQLMASLRLDFPQPLGPTMAAMPEPGNFISVLFQQSTAPSYYRLSRGDHTILPARQGKVKRVGDDI